MTPRVSLFAACSIVLLPSGMLAQDKTVTTTRAPVEAMQIAARLLAADGFDIVQSDATLGLLSAERKASPKSLGGAVKCKWPQNSMASTMGESAFRVTLTIAKSDSGSTVSATSKVRTDYGKTMGPFRNTPASDTDCTSTGLVEMRLMDSLAVHR